MRDIKTLTKEEIIEFINKVDIGEFKISKPKYIKDENLFEIYITTEWTNNDEKGKKDNPRIKDRWEFTSDYFNTEYPLDNKDYSLLYYEFLLAKGFKENRFI